MAPEQNVAESVVHVGSIVTVRGHGEIEHDVTVVDKVTDNGLRTWQLTSRTPLGRALLGARAGDEVRVITEAGTVKFTIVRINRDSPPQPCSVEGVGGSARRPRPERPAGSDAGPHVARGQEGMGRDHGGTGWRTVVANWLRRSLPPPSVGT